MKRGEVTLIHRSPCYIVPWELCDTELRASPLEFRRRSALGTVHTFHNRRLDGRSKKKTRYKTEIFNTDPSFLKLASHFVSYTVSYSVEHSSVYSVIHWNGNNIMRMI